MPAEAITMDEFHGSQEHAEAVAALSKEYLHLLAQEKIADSVIVIVRDSDGHLSWRSSNLSVESFVGQLEAVKYMVHTTSYLMSDNGEETDEDSEDD